MRLISTANGLMDRGDHYCTECEKLKKRNQATILKGIGETPYGRHQLIICNTCFVGDSHMGDISVNENEDQEIAFMNWFSIMIEAETRGKIRKANTLFSVAAKAFDIEITKRK